MYLTCIDLLCSGWVLCRLLATEPPFPVAKRRFETGLQCLHEDAAPQADLLCLFAFGLVFGFCNPDKMGVP